MRPRVAVDAISSSTLHNGTRDAARTVCAMGAAASASPTRALTSAPSHYTAERRNWDGQVVTLPPPTSPSPPRRGRKRGRGGDRKNAGSRCIWQPARCPSGPGLGTKHGLLPYAGTRTIIQVHGTWSSMRARPGRGQEGAEDIAPACCRCRRQTVRCATDLTQDDAQSHD